MPPPAPPGPVIAITGLRVLVVPASSGSAPSCAVGEQLLRPMAGTKWDLDFNTGAGGDYTYVCVERKAADSPISALLGFHTPSAAEPFGDCPANYAKVLGNSSAIGANDLNHGSLNQGAMFLCYQRGGAPIYNLAGLAGGGTAVSAAGCRLPGWEAITGPPAYPGVFNFDPAGVGLILCADRSAAAASAMRDLRDPPAHLA
uniref:MABP domain-containing protein n=1 Tax=Haptolina ericina TaxID=156174 RepID=A0A7S3ES71_9EUKA